MAPYNAQGLGKLSNQKGNKTWELVQSGDDSPPPPPPLAVIIFQSLIPTGTWDFLISEDQLKLGTFSIGKLPLVSEPAPLLVMETRKADIGFCF